MNYEFHVGDYVKTRAGYIGYIDGINDVEDDNIAVRVCYSDGASGYFRVDDLNVTNNFLRIGAYDFTKKEKKKIENLVKPQWSMPVEDLINKINELVDAVNKLMEKEEDR